MRRSIPGSTFDRRIRMATSGARLPSCRLSIELPTTHCNSVAEGEALTEVVMTKLAAERVAMQAKMATW